MKKRLDLVVEFDVFKVSEGRKGLIQLQGSDIDFEQKI